MGESIYCCRKSGVRDKSYPRKRVPSSQLETPPVTKPDENDDVKEKCERRESQASKSLSRSNCKEREENQEDEERTMKQREDGSLICLIFPRPRPLRRYTQIGTLYQKKKLTDISTRFPLCPLFSSTLLSAEHPNNKR